MDPWAGDVGEKRGKCGHKQSLKLEYDSVVGSGVALTRDGLGKDMPLRPCALKHLCSGQLQAEWCQSLWALGGGPAGGSPFPRVAEIHNLAGAGCDCLIMIGWRGAYAP